MQKIKRDLNGSFTVEAALLMTVLIPLLTALIYLGFYQHDKVWIANKTRTEAMEAALDQDRKNQMDWSGVLACGNVSGGVKRGKNKVTATGKATFRIPGFVARFFMGGQMEINSKAEVSVKNAKNRFKNIEICTGRGGITLWMFLIAEIKIIIICTGCSGGTDRRGISGTDAGWKSYSSFIKMQSPDDGRKSGLFL